MKLAPSELIFTFRKKISSTSLLLIILLSACVIGLIVTRFSMKIMDQPFMNGSFSAISFILVVFISMLFKRRKDLLRLLKPGSPDASIEAFETYLNKDREYFRSSDISRLIIGTVILIALVLLIIYKRDHSITGIVFGTFIGFILLSMWKSWMLMKDGMMLQDLKHALHDQPSEIS